MRSRTRAIAPITPQVSGTIWKQSTRAWRDAPAARGRAHDADHRRAQTEVSSRLGVAHQDTEPLMAHDTTDTGALLDMPSGRRGVNRAQVRARNGAQGARRGGARGARHGDFADHVTRTAGQSEREASGALVGGQRMRGAAAGDRASGAVGACQHRSRWSRCGCWGGLIVIVLLCAVCCVSLSFVPSCVV